MEKDIMLGRVEGAKTRWLDVLKEFTGMSLHQLNENGMNRSECSEDHQNVQNVHLFRGSP